jgi:hypothetical protein
MKGRKVVKSTRKEIPETINNNNVACTTDADCNSGSYCNDCDMCESSTANPPAAVCTGGADYGSSRFESAEGVLGDTQEDGECAPGYMAESQPKRVCTSTGWQLLCDSCKEPEITCSGITDVESAYFDAANGELDATDSGVCKQGFASSIAPERTCTATGWNITTNTCTELAVTCSGITDVESAYFDAADGELDAIDSGVCKTGFNSTIAPERTCTITGWNITSNLCTPVVCSGTIEGYKFSPIDDAPPGVVQDGICDDGYEAENPTIPVVRYCSAEGNWEIGCGNCIEQAASARAVLSTSKNMSTWKWWVLMSILFLLFIMLFILCISTRLHSSTLSE